MKSLAFRFKEEMNINPTPHPQYHQRRTIRLKGYDYSQEGLYFITICCNRWGNNMRFPFGNIENREMKLNQFGQIAFDEWVKLSERFPNFELDVFQIMPDHLHGIISLNNVGAGFTPAQYMDDVVSPINADNTQNQISTIDLNTRATARVALTTVDLSYQITILLTLPSFFPPWYKPLPGTCLSQTGSGQFGCGCR